MEIVGPASLPDKLRLLENLLWRVARHAGSVTYVFHQIMSDETLVAILANGFVDPLAGVALLYWQLCTLGQAAAHL